MMIKYFQKIYKVYLYNVLYFNR